MTDQHDNNNEQAAGGSPVSGSHPPENVTTPAAVAQAAATPEARRGSSALAWLALLLVLLVAAGLGWSVWQVQEREAAITARLQAVESAARPETGMQAEMEGRWQGQFDSLRQQLQSGTQLLNEQQARSEEAERAVAGLQSQVDQQRAELARYGANDGDAWLLAEVQYLLRMAHQRLLMAGDAAAAQALLGSADGILLQLNDAGLHEVRAAVAADLAALRAVPTVDVEGIYLRLAALADQAGKLVIFRLPEEQAEPERAPADSWQARLRSGYEAALAKLSDYIIIRRRDVPMQALMDPQWEGLVRQNLRMLLEQAQIALLSGNQMLYRASLERAQHWVAQFIDSDEAAAQAMSREIGQLEAIDIATNMPDISNSVQALDAVVKQRTQRGGSE